MPNSRGRSVWSMLCWPRARQPSRRFLMRFLVKISLPALLAAVLLTACGGGGGAVTAGDIAVVGKTHVTQAQFDTVLAQQKANASSSFPKQGTSEYESIKSQIVSGLVQQAERDDRAKSDGIVVTAKQIDARLNAIRKQNNLADDKAYQAQLKKQHLTDRDVRESVRTQLINEALVKEITKGIKVSAGEIHDYYLQNSQ